MAVTLNQSGFDRAQELIESDNVVRDERAEWEAHRPAAEEEDTFIREHGIGEYGRWHLAIDVRVPEESKRRYRFILGDFRSLHRGAVLDARARIRGAGHGAIRAAADILLRSLDALV